MLGGFFNLMHIFRKQPKNFLLELFFPFTLWEVYPLSVVILIGFHVPSFFGLNNLLIKFAIFILLVLLPAFLIFVISFLKRTDRSVYKDVPAGWKRFLVFINHSSARYLAGLYDWNNALTKYERVLALKAVPEDKDLYGIVLHDMAACHVTEGNRGKALEKFDHAMEVYKADCTLRLGKARVHIARLNAYVYFGERPGKFENPDILEKEFLSGMEICSPQDRILCSKDHAYLENTDLPKADIYDPYGASKAHCQYSWALLTDSPNKALWHAKVAYNYSELIKDVAFDTVWGLRDGIVGKYWKQNVALYTIGDCYVLLSGVNGIPNAREYYRRGCERIPFLKRKWYFMGNYYWRYLVQEENIEEARKWLRERLRVAEKDNYTWCVALAHLHQAELEQYYSERVVKTEYEAALQIADKHEFASLTAQAKKGLATLAETRTSHFPNKTRPGE